MSVTPALADLAQWAAPAAVAAGGLLLGFLVQRALLPRLAVLAARSPWKMDDFLVAAIRWPVVLWVALGALRVAVRMAPVDHDTDALLGTVLLVLVVFSVTWAIARFVASAVRASVTQGGLSGASLLATIARILVVLAGVLVILQMLGIHITGILAALGVGGLAVGLALQDTLGNLFAGIRIVAGRKIRPGDYIRLDSGQDGTVVDISWGQTTIRQGLGNAVIVPNTKLAQAVTINYSLPAPEQLFTVTLTVAHGSDLEVVERIATDEARAAMRGRPEGSADFEPVVLFQPFTDAGIPFVTVMKARAFVDSAGVTSDFVKRVVLKFGAAGIRAGTPARRIVTEDGKPRP